MDETEKVKISYYDYFLFMVFPIITILISSILSLSFIPINSGYMRQVFPQTELGIIGDIFYAMIFLIVAILSAFLIYFLIEKEKENLLKYLLGVATGFSSIIIITLYITIIINSLILSEFLYQILFSLGLIIGITIGTISSYSLISNKISVKIRNGFMILYSVIVSTFLALILPTWTVIVILVGISLYDIYSVKEGPIRKVIEISEERKDFQLNLTVSVGEWEIGIGDLIFYSFLISHTVLYFGIIPWIFSIVGVFIGLIITLQILIRKKLLPGLPIAISLGMLPILILLIASI